jgi:hypothetical protein
MKFFGKQKQKEIYEPRVLDDYETRALRNPTDRQISEESYYWQLVSSDLRTDETRIATAPGHRFSPSDRDPISGNMYLTSSAFIWQSEVNATKIFMDRIPLEEIIDWQPGKAWAPDMPGNSYFIAYRDPGSNTDFMAPELPEGTRIMWLLYPLEPRALDFCATFYDLMKRHGGWQGKFGTLSKDG